MINTTFVFFFVSNLFLLQLLLLLAHYCIGAFVGSLSATVILSDCRLHIVAMIFYCSHLLASFIALSPLTWSGAWERTVWVDALPLQCWICDAPHRRMLGQVECALYFRLLLFCCWFVCCCYLVIVTLFYCFCSLVLLTDFCCCYCYTFFIKFFFCICHWNYMFFSR